MIRAVLFDLDDTLVDQGAAAHAAVVPWAREHGLIGTDTELRRRWEHISAPHFKAWQRRLVTFQEQRRARVRDFLPHLDLVSDDDADAHFADYLRAYEANWHPFDDAAPTLFALRRRGLGCSVLTNGETEQQGRKLQVTGLSGLVDTVICSSTLPAGKPDSRAFQGALDLLGLAPAEVLMVGDSLENDVRGAQAVGMSAILLDRSGAYLNHPGLIVIKSLSGIPL